MGGETALVIMNQSLYLAIDERFLICARVYCSSSKVLESRQANISESWQGYKFLLNMQA